MKHLKETDVSARKDNSKKPHSAGRIPLWISIVVILGAVLTLIGAVVSKVDPALLTGNAPITEATRVYTDYMFARNLSLALLLLLLLALTARRMLAGFMVLIALIQFVDLLDDLARGAFVLVPGLLVFTVVFLFGASKLFGKAFWRLDAWREVEKPSPETR